MTSDHTTVPAPAATMAPSMTAALFRSGERRWPSRMLPVMSSPWPTTRMMSAGDGRGRSTPMIIPCTVRMAPPTRKQAAAPVKQSQVRRTSPRLRMATRSDRPTDDQPTTWTTTPMIEADPLNPATVDTTRPATRKISHACLPHHAFQVTPVLIGSPVLDWSVAVVSRSAQH